MVAVVVVAVAVCIWILQRRHLENENSGRRQKPIRGANCLRSGAEHYNPGDRPNLFVELIASGMAQGTKTQEAA